MPGQSQGLQRTVSYRFWFRAGISVVCTDHLEALSILSLYPVASNEGVKVQEGRVVQLVFVKRISQVSHCRRKQFKQSTCSFGHLADHPTKQSTWR